MAKKFQFTPLQSPSTPKKEEPFVKKPVNIRAAIPGDLHQHLVSHCFYNFTTHEEVITQALVEFLQDKENKPLPEKVRNRPRPGRKANPK